MMNTRPLHPSLPQRPSRTSDRASPYPFSRVELRTGAMRCILGIYSSEGRPALVWMGVHVGGERHSHGKILIFPNDAPMVASAIAASRSGVVGRRDAGDIVPTTTRRDVFRIHVWSRVGTDGTGCVSFGRRDQHGQPKGNAVSIRGSELDALANALDWLSEEP